MRQRFKDPIANRLVERLRVGSRQVWIEAAGELSEDSAGWWEIIEPRLLLAGASRQGQGQTISRLRNMLMFVPRYLKKVK